MTNSKMTKRSLLSSAVALLLCFVMLLGTTYAWFTDTVTSTGNIIKSGKLDVTMHWANGTEAVPAVDSADWTDASTGAIFNYDKWEPGYVDVKHVQIANVGTLAFKYQVAIVANGAVSDLADVIDVYFVDPATQITGRTALTDAYKIGTLTEVLAGASGTAGAELLPKESDTITIALKMQETAGNEYQDLSIGTDFSVQVFATQLTYEKDSFDDQYDAMATIDTEEELLEALAADYDLIALGANIAITDSVVIPAEKTVTIDLMGYTMSQVNAQQTAAYAMISNKGDLTIKDSIGSGKISYEDATPYTSDPGWASNTIRNEGTLTVNGGTVENLTSEAVMNYGYPHAIDAYQGSVTTINGGTVKSLNYDSIRMFCNSETLATKVVINGGTIVNRVSFQDPNSTRPGYGILEINGGDFVTINGVNANVRLLNFCQNCSNMKATVTGGTFDKGFKTQDIAGSGITTSDWLTMGTTGTATPVTTAAELKDAFANGGEVILAADAFVDEKIEIPAGKEVVLDLNGNELSGAFTQAGVSALIQNKGTLTIKNGSVTSLATNPDTDWNPEGFPTYASNTISNSGVLVIGEGAVIENQTNVGGASYAIDNYAGATLTVNGGVIKAKDVAIRINTANINAANNVTINGGEITGKRAIWIHIAGSNAAQAPEVNLTINGGDFNSTSDFTIYSYSYGQSFANVNVTIAGGDFEKDVAFGGGYKGDQENVTVTGGTFGGNLGRYLANDGWVDIAKP